MLSENILPMPSAQAWDTHFTENSTMTTSSSLKPPRKSRSRQRLGVEDRPKRKKCPLKEKERNLALNRGYEELQSKIKYINENSKIAKVKILRAAISYIGYLQNLLNTADGQCNSLPQDFALRAMEIVQAKNCYTHRAMEEMAKSPTSKNPASPQPTDPGYCSSTPNSNYSSDYFDIPSTHPAPYDHSSFYTPFQTCYTPFSYQPPPPQWNNTSL